jgi:hypothetical protein
VSFADSGGGSGGGGSSGGSGSSGGGGVAEAAEAERGRASAAAAPPGRAALQTKVGERTRLRASARCPAARAPADAFTWPAMRLHVILATWLTRFVCNACARAQTKTRLRLSDPLCSRAPFFSGEERARRSAHMTATQKVQATLPPSKSGSMMPMKKTGRPPQNPLQQRGQDLASSGIAQRVEKRAGAEGDVTEHPTPKKGKYSALKTGLCLASRCRQGKLCCNKDKQGCAKQGKKKSGFTVFCCSACAVEGEGNKIDASKGAWFCSQECWGAAHNKA